MNTIKLTALVMVLMLGVSVSAWASSADDVNTVTVAVNNVLSISDTTGNFTLTFSDFEIGQETPTQLVTYRVKANNMTTGALTGVVAAKLNALIYGVDLKGDPGAYANIGSSGNVPLSESGAGFITIGTLATNLADKAATTGNQQKVLNGNLPIIWKAVATQDLTSGSYPATLTVTLKDI